MGALTECLFLLIHKKYLASLNSMGGLTITYIYQGDFLYWEYDKMVFIYGKIFMSENFTNKAINLREC